MLCVLKSLYGSGSGLAYCEVPEEPEFGSVNCRASTVATLYRMSLSASVPVSAASGGGGALEPCCGALELGLGSTTN